MLDEPSKAIERLDEDFVQRQADYLRRFRAEGPVHQVVFPHGAKVWLVTRYADCRALALDPRVGKDGRRLNEMYTRHSTLNTGASLKEEPDDPGFDDDLATHVLNSDPPSHTRLRALAIKAVTPRRQESLRPRVEQAVEELLDKLAEAPVVDLLSEFAWPLPLSTICDLFGMPEEDRDNFRRWSGTLTGAGQNPEDVADASKKMTDYANALINARRADPGGDMISELLRARVDGDRLTQGELVGMIFIMVTAGHVTTVHSIGNAVFNLLTHPEELAKLRADPSLIPAAIDELMRFDPAASVGTFRFTKAEIPVGDVVIPANQILALSWGSANRDAERFADPDQLNVTRCPQGTLSFGHGPHYCIGIPMAKMQIEIALDRLLARYPDLRLAVKPEEVRWASSALLHGLAGLPVSVFPADQATGSQADIRRQIDVLEAELLAAPAGLGEDRLRLHHALAADYGQLGDYRNALHHAQHELSLRTFWQGPDHPGTLSARHYLARWTGEAGDATAARDQYAALLPVRERVLGAEHPDTLTTRANLAHWTGEADNVGT